MSDHLDRTLTAMADDNIDVLLLGRTPNVRYVSGANQLALTGYPSVRARLHRRARVRRRCTC